jgi:hypothetical protein
MPSPVARSVLLAAGVAGLAAASAQTRTIYSVTVPTEIAHDSNPTMSVSGSSGTTWLRVRPSFTAAYVRDTQVYSVEAALSAEKSSNPSVARDRLDPRVRGAWRLEDPLNKIEAAAVMDRRAFRAVDVIEQVPTGVDGTRTLLGLTGKWARELNERTSVHGDLRQDWVRYSNASTPDYRHTVGSVRMNRQWDERRTWYAGANGQLYRTQDGGGRSTVAGVLLGWQQAFSESWRVDANVGAMRFIEPTHDNEWQGAVTTEYTGERWQGAVDVARTAGVNSSFGRLLVTELLRLRARYDLTATSRVEFNAGHSREKAVQSRRTVGTLAYVKELSPAWDLSLRAALRRQEGPGGTATAREVGVLLVYHVPDL